MKIDRNADVLPPRYAAKSLRKVMGSYLAQASQTDARQAHEWAAGCATANRLRAAWEEHQSALEREVREAGLRARTAQTSLLRDAVTEASISAARRLLELLQSELREAKQAAQESGEIFSEMTRFLGRHRNAAFISGRNGTPAELLPPLRRQLDAARSRLGRLLKNDREALHRIILHKSSPKGAASTISTKAGIDLLTEESFRCLIEELVQRDGYTRHGESEQTPLTGEDLLVSASGRMTLALCCQTFGPPEDPNAGQHRTCVSAPALIRAHRAASQLQAELAVFVTNASFSATAQRYAREQGIVLIGREALTDWVLSLIQLPDLIAPCDVSADDTATRPDSGAVPAPYRAFDAGGDVMDAGAYLDGDTADDASLASFLFALEGLIAREGYHALDRHRQAVQHEYGEIANLSTGPESPTSGALWEAHRRLREALANALAAAREATDRAGNVWRALRDECGTDLRQRYRRSADPVPSELEGTAEGWRWLSHAQQQLSETLAGHREETHGLALLEIRCQAFLKSPESIGLDTILRLSPVQFERTVARIARRDGLTVTREHGGAGDLGADVIAVMADGRTVVFQCKHISTGRRSVGSRVIQNLNGTAQDIHGADIVVAATNGGFSKDARALATRLGIHLIDEHRLQRWATWGEPLTTVLGIADSSEATAS
ncbi:restriction endonuclease [Streptomyces syringium]|uniref:restriction endonuclease n=1 Tax=Streptomyces syringium TaxID=76729 RepID=UPI0036B845D9